MKIFQHPFQMLLRNYAEMFTFIELFNNICAKNFDRIDIKMKVFQALLMESKINARIINNLTIEFCSTHIIYMIYVGKY